MKHEIQEGIREEQVGRRQQHSPFLEVEVNDKLDRVLQDTERISADRLFRVSANPSGNSLHVTCMYFNGYMHGTCMFHEGARHVL